MRFKKGVKINGTRPELGLAVMVAQKVFDEHGYDFEYTSGLEGRHSRKSLHYAGSAFDCAIKHIGDLDLAERIADEIRVRLTDEFDVVFKPDHIHIEFQPKRPEQYNQ